MQVSKSIYSFFLFILCQYHAIGQEELNGSNLFRENFQQSGPIQDSAHKFFLLVENTMNLDRYDSAEYWLSKLGELIDFKKQDIFNYYYHSRQAEIFYYNNLLQLGAQQAKMALLVATKMNDFQLMGDAHNLAGLISLNLEFYQDAIINLNTGLEYYRKSKKNPDYPSFSEIYHLYGNLGEVYYNQKEYSKALFEFENSIKEARQLNAPRAEALGYITSGEALLILNQLDDAITRVEKGKEIAVQNKDYDIELFAMGVLAEIAQSKGNKALTLSLADSGMVLIDKQLKSNPYYTLVFLKKIKVLFEYFSEFRKTSEIMENIISLERDIRKKNNQQIESILQAGIKNENRLLQLEIQEARQQKIKNNIITVVLLLIIALLILAGFYYRNHLKQKLALANLHKKISENLHDDIGATLSSLNIYSSIAETTLEQKPQKAKEMLQRITEQSKLLMENMDDMVWSMKTNQEDTLPLALKIKNFGSELLHAKNIKCQYQINDEAFKQFNTFDSRKHILLIIKEAMNNIAKYSQATEATIYLNGISNHLILRINDNGVGFPVSKSGSGNGLKNMESRCKALNGALSIESNDSGTTLTASIPIP